MSSLGLSQDIPFAFRQRYGKINWRLVQQIDIDEAVQLADFSKLSLVKETLTFSQFEQDDLERYSENLLVKAFRLMQLLIEHQDYDLSRMTLEGDRRNTDFKTAHDTIIELQARIKTLEEELATANKELKNKTHILGTYEYILRQPAATGLVSQMLSQHNAVKCPHCLKLFMSTPFLEKHISKRHGLLSKSLKEEARTTHQSKELESTLESMKMLMTRSIQSINETNAKQLESMQTAVQRRLEEVQQTQVEMEKTMSRPGTAETTELTSSESVLKEVLRSQQEFRSSMEARDQTLKEQLRIIEERQLKSASESHRNEESFRLHVEEVIKKNMETMPRGRTRTRTETGVVRSDDGSSQYEESEDVKGKSNAGEMESDQESDKNPLTEVQSAAVTRRMPGLMAENPFAPLSPSPAIIKEGTEVEVTDEQPAILVLGSPIESAAVELGVPRSETANVSFVLKAYVKAKDNSPWIRTVKDGKTCYQHKSTGEIVDEHPDTKRFQLSLKRAQLLGEKVDYSSFLGLHPMNVTQTPNCHEGIPTLFNHKIATFQKYVGENKKKISSSLAKLKDRIPENLMSLQERHQERMRSEPAYRKYLEEVTDEADNLLTRALARRSHVEPAKPIFAKHLEKRFAEDTAKKMLRVDERDPRVGRDSI